MDHLALVQSALPTWAQVRDSYQRGMLRLGDAVEAFAEMGDKLAVLKNPKVTEHGEFMRRCAELFYPDQKEITDSLLQRARVRAGYYMRLAAYRNLWAPHHPKSMREAMAHVAKVVPLQPAVVDARRSPTFPTGERGMLWAQARKRRFTRSVSMISGNLQGLEDFDFLPLVAAFDDKEIRLWCKQLRSCGRTLSKLAGKLASLQTQRLLPSTSGEKPST